MKTFVLLLVGFIGVLLVASAFYTEFRRRQIEARHEPAGAFLIVNGVRLHAVDLVPENWTPRQTTLVFIHGASGNLLDPLLAFQGKVDGRFRSIFVDRPGHGFSERGPGDAHSPRRQADLIAGLLRKLGVEKAVAIGHSWGGAVAAELGLGHGDLIKGLVFVAPATHPWGGGGINWYYTLASLPVAGAIFTRTVTLPIAETLTPAAIDGVFAPDAPPEGYAEKISLPLLYRPATFQANAGDVANLLDHVSVAALDYPKIRMPAIILTGDRDSVVYAHIHSAGLARDLKGAELRLLPGAGHMPHHTRADAVMMAITDVVERIERLAETKGLPVEMASGPAM